MRAAIMAAGLGVAAAAFLAGYLCAGVGSHGEAPPAGRNPGITGPAPQGGPMDLLPRLESLDRKLEALNRKVDLSLQRGSESEERGGGDAARGNPVTAPTAEVRGAAAVVQALEEQDVARARRRLVPKLESWVTIEEEHLASLSDGDSIERAREAIQALKAKLERVRQATRMFEIEEVEKELEEMGYRTQR